MRHLSCIARSSTELFNWKVFNSYLAMIYILSCALWLVFIAEAHIRHEGHTHYQPKEDGSKNLLKDKAYVRDYEHVKEDLQDLYNKDFAAELSEMELESYYFQLHDLNHDQKLDGLELLAAMNHVLNREDEISQKDLLENPQVKESLQNWWNTKFKEDSEYIDEMLKEEDLDQDGYLSYAEFISARQKGR
ncbi:hypothetical protein JTE90_017103 [Oedothorax gibbosus]|uniref:EF-hand domain-containing protein n=1 Tax=Oedothorax gibbosus TaxID=931172 RepID=A0AAV6UI93_9ARAC|nr:hypothetical protein JTE90_017103 [Oedothorax gibbosus]